MLESPRRSEILIFDLFIRILPKFRSTRAEDPLVSLNSSFPAFFCISSSNSTVLRIKLA